jgi:hypothetical protein
VSVSSNQDSSQGSSSGLDYEEVLDTATEHFRENFRENSGPTVMGVESETPIVDEDGVMPQAPEYQDVISEGLWKSIEGELEENVDGYGQEFRFELDEVKEDGHGEKRPVELSLEGELPEGFVDTPTTDWDLGGQLENDSGAMEVGRNGEFGTLLDILTSFKSGAAKYLAENREDLEFAEQGLTRQFRNPEEVPEEAVGRGEWEDKSRDGAREFAEEAGDLFTSVKYYVDYVGTIFGSQVLENMFGGSTQLTSGLWSDNGELDVDRKVGEEMPYRVVLEGAFDTLTSNVSAEGEDRHTNVNEWYWGRTHEQHVTTREDVDENPRDRMGTPWEMIQQVQESEDSLEGMVDHYMSQHNMVWISPPDEEYVEIEGEPEEYDHEEYKLLAVDPEGPKTPKEFIEDGEVSFSKIVSDEDGNQKTVKGTINLSDMDEEEARQYHMENLAGAHLPGIHHDVRPKFDIGGFEFRNSRQNYGSEPSVALAKAVLMPHGDKIVETLESYGIDPSDPETVPDYGNDEFWRDVFEDLYDEEVMETAGEMAPGYAREMAGYVEAQLDPEQSYDQKAVAE